VKAIISKETQQSLTEMKTMRAAVIDDVDRIAIRECPLPVLQNGEALIKVKYCGICGSDLHVLHGEHPTAKFPVIPGHEFVGELADICGETPVPFSIGDMVVAQPFFSCGNCVPCAMGRENICRSLRFMGAHVDGGFAQYVKVSIRKMYKLPRDIDLQLAALVEPVAVAVHDVRLSGLSVGGSALVIGGGPIGLLIAIVARHAGAGTVVICEINEFRRRAAQELGFRTLNPLDEDYADRLSAIHEDCGGFDVAFEVSGSMPGITTAVDMTRIAGVVMVVGMTGEPHPVSLSKVFQKELEIKGVRIHSQINFIGALELLKSGVLADQLRVLISEIYPMDKLEHAFIRAQSGSDFFKLLISMDSLNVPQTEIEVE